MTPETISLFECVLNQDAPGVARAISQKAALDEWCKMHIVTDKDGSERLCDCKEKYHVHRDLYINGRSPLIFAAMDGNIEIAGLLINAGADVLDYDSYEMSALHYAARNYHPKMVQLLVDCGADIDERDAVGLTPLDYLEESVKSAIEEASSLLEKIKLKSKPYK